MTATIIARPGEWPGLTAGDRCDACGARAVGRAVLAGSTRSANGMLLMCGHHLRQHGPRIVATGGMLVVRPEDAVAALAPRPRQGRTRSLDG
jgi:hypothetical protein